MSGLKAISGNVFVRRDHQEADYNGIDISDKAQVKSMYGEVVACDCEFAEVGDRVHIPHYGVLDIDYDGEEFAMFKAEQLFFVNGSVVNGYVHVRKCENDHIRDESGEVALYMTEHNIEFTHWVEVIDVPKGSRKMLQDYIGLYCVAPENDQKLARIGRGSEFALHESLIEFLTEDQ